MAELASADARRIALAAQGLVGPRPARVDRRMLRGMIDRLGVVQLDSVNVLARSHYLPAWSRLGAYDVATLDELVWGSPARRTCFEYWGHEASILPIALQPLLRWRMARAAEHAWRHVRAMQRRRTVLQRVLAIVEERGPIGAGEIDVGRAGKGGWWEWSDAKSAIEWLFWIGAVTTATRRGFERLYDLTARVLPAEILATPTPREADAQRALVEIAARALGIATEHDLRDYFRLRPPAARAAIAELVEAGALVRTTVDGWTKPAYLHRDATLPSTIDPDRCAVLSPFDNAIWFRDRTERLFGMRYRIEIYTPAPKRIYGYYVLPVLLGDRLVARVDLKLDRTARKLLVHATHLEPGVAKRTIDGPLRAELAALERWLVRG